MRDSVISWAVRNSPSEHLADYLLSMHRNSVVGQMRWCGCTVGDTKFTLKVNTAEVHGYLLYMKRQIEPIVGYVMRHLVQSNRVVLDVGANIGYYTVLAATACPTCQVWSFEPTPLTFAILCENIQANQLQNAIAHQCAIGESKAILKLNAYGDQALNSISPSIDTPHPFFPQGPIQVLDVPCITIDHFIDENRIKRVDIIKFDIEGYEYFALKGAERLLSQPDAPILICEVSPVWLNRFGLTVSQVISYVTSFDYRCFEMTRYGLLERTKLDVASQSEDFVFAKSAVQIKELQSISQAYYSGFRRLKGQGRKILRPVWHWISRKR